MKSDTCPFTRTRPLPLCVKQSFPTLSEVFTTNFCIILHLGGWSQRHISIFWKVWKVFWGCEAASPWKREGERAGLRWSRLFVPRVDWATLRCGSALPVAVMMHVLAVSLQTPPPHPHQLSVCDFTICFGSPPFCPLIFFSTPSCVLCADLPPSSFVCPSPTQFIVHPVPPISALVVPSDPTPFPHPPSPLPPADGDPKSSCASLHCSPWKFFFFFFGG